MYGTRGLALISVSDKTGLTELAQGLVGLGLEVVSTGGTAKAIAGAGVAVRQVEDLTGFPEMLDGRVKTLHPAVHGGILARRTDSAHLAALEKHSIQPIDVVVVNLYPFRSAVLQQPPPEYQVGVENIDIGGPAMIRAAAKNHEAVAVVVDPEDYQELLEKLGESQEEAVQFRKRLAWKAFQHCASYDATVAEWLWGRVGDGGPPPAATLPMTRLSGLRYGENPHQEAAVYRDDSLEESGRGGVTKSVQHHGKEMSYNNYLDADAAYQCVCDYQEAACVIVKHTNPCGVAVNDDLNEAYRLAVQADPVSAFGGIVAFNREVDEELAKEIREYRSPTDNTTRMFYEIIIAPSYSEEGLKVICGKSKTLRILEAPPRAPAGRGVRQVAGGWLWQGADTLRPDDMQWEVVSEVQPSEQQLADLKVAWLAVKHVKSNAITIARNGRLLGMGSGQPNRVKSAQIALEKAGGMAKGAALASDAFFPFSWGDAVEMACQAGVKVIAHPGGSIRDSDAVECCNKYGVALLTTGHRHFKH